MLAAVVGLVLYLYDNLRANDVELDFGFLDQQSGFPIVYTDHGPSDTVRDAVLTGLRNTITVAVLGIVLTLILGTLLGIARLSDNWLVRRAAGAYVEIFRNVPPLLVIVFVNSLALATLPPIEAADEYLGLLVVSVAEIGVVAPVPTATAGPTRRCSSPRWRPRSPWPGGGRGSRSAPAPPPAAGCGRRD